MSNVIAVTGHRPKKISPELYDPMSDLSKRYINSFKKFLIENNCDYAISGMALGIDTLFAIAVLQLRKEGYSIKLECAIPCLNHGDKWPPSSQHLYDMILNKSDKVTLVSNIPYNRNVMQIRNEYMVDHCDLLLAIYDGGRGGTENCIQYAKTKECNIKIFSPFDFIKE